MSESQTIDMEAKVTFVGPDKYNPDEYWRVGLRADHMDDPIYCRLGRDFDQPPKGAVIGAKVRVTENYKTGKTYYNLGKYHVVQKATGPQKVSNFTSNSAKTNGGKKEDANWDRKDAIILAQTLMKVRGIHADDTMEEILDFMKMGVDIHLKLKAHYDARTSSPSTPKPQSQLRFNQEAGDPGAAREDEYGATMDDLDDEIPF